MGLVGPRTAAGKLVEEKLPWGAELLESQGPSLGPSSRPRDRCFLGKRRLEVVLVYGIVLCCVQWVCLLTSETRDAG